MIEYNDTDLALDDEGDFELDATGDFALAEGFDCTVDSMQWIAKSQDKDSEVYPDAAANLEELIGMPNTREVGTKGAERLINALIENGIVNMQDLVVIPLPTGDEILYYIVVERDGEQAVVEYPLKLNFGG